MHFNNHNILLIRNLILFFLFLYFPSLFSNNTLYSFQYVGINEGLSDKTVNTIFKDSEGYIWIGTGNGLNRYDGSNILTFTYDADNSSSLAGNSINLITEDKNHNLYIGCSRQGLSVFDRNLHLFKRIQYKQQNANSLASNNISWMLPDSFGNLWLTSSDSGLTLYNPVKEIFTRFKQGNKGLSTNNLSSIIDYKKGIFLIVSNSGFDIFDVEKKSFRFIPFPDKQHYVSGIKTKPHFYKSNSGTFYLLGINGVYVLNERDFSLSKLKLKIPENAIFTDILEDDNGVLWIATDGNGIYHYNLHTKELSQSVYSPEIPNSLYSNSVFQLYKDNHGIIWVGTFSGGANIFSKYQSRFEYYSSTREGRFSISYPSVLALANSNDKDVLWIGTDGGGLNSLNKSTRQITHYQTNINTPAIIKELTVITSLLEDSQGLLWIGTYNKGLVKYNPKTNVAVHFLHNPNDPNSLSNNNVWSLLEDNDQNIWVGTLNNGLNKFNKGSNSFTRYTNNVSDATSISSNRIACIYQDRQNRIWLGTYGGGANVFNAASNQFKRFVLNSNDTSSISSNTVESIVEDANGNIWLATTEGLNLYDEENEKFIKFYERNGLIDNSLRAVALDKDNNLWISSKKGISMLEMKSGRFFSFNKNDGLQNTYFNKALVCGGEGKVYAGGIYGLNAFIPDSIFMKIPTPEIVFTDFKVFNESVSFGKANSLLKNHISKTKEITLHHSQNVFSIDFTELDYATSKKSHFKYILEGFDKKWLDAGEKKSITYTNLDPGDYIFKVSVVDFQGNWGEKITSLVIHIKPPIWRTWWFRTLSVLITIFLISLIIWNKISSIKKQKEYLEKVVEEKTEDLKKTNEMLVEQQQEILTQKEEIERQNLLLIDKTDEIVRKNKELESYSSSLEVKVAERTNELEKALHKAEESDNLKSAFLTNMSHEIRTPMNSILGFSKLLLHNDFSDNERDMFITNINKSCNSLLHLITDLIDLSKIETAQIQIVNKKFDLNGLLTHSLAKYNDIKSELGKNNIELILNVPESGVQLNTDAYRFEQIVNNLIDNALKFTEIGQIEVGYSTIDSTVELFVKDTGIGIPEHLQQQIFSSFFKIENQKKFYDGTGLGLAICYKLSEMLGGSIEVKSTPDIGSIFTVKLPFK